jgi:hypothetical protein
MVWRRPVGEWLSHDFRGGWLVSTSRDKLEVLDPRNGQPVAAYS